MGGEPAYVSTGSLPDGPRISAVLGEAWQRLRSNSEGHNSDVYPALARVPSDLFGICLAATSGATYKAGDADHEFTIMSVAKPFVFALACDRLGVQEVRRKVGVNATGLPFNSLEAVERSPDGRTNPMVNPGAIAVSSLVAGGSASERWCYLQDGLSRFAGRHLALDEEVLASALATNLRNRSIAQLLQSRGLLGMEADEAVELYTRQCSLGVTAADLAIMGATLAGGGVNPLTGERVIEAAICHYTLAVMSTAGLYESSGDWLFDVGLPAKSGIGGGIVAVAPGKGALGTFAPRLDRFGNSVKGRKAAEFLSQALGLDLYASRAAIRHAA